MKSIGLITALSFASIAAPAHGAPAQLLNKTITISFTATGVARLPQGGQTSFSTQVSQIIYVSGAGHLSMRFRATNRSGSRGGDARASFSFQGNRLVGVVPFETGARQLTITFDPGFSRCTASVIEGHSGGVIQRRGPDGRMYEVTGGSTSSVSCSIQSGVAFAG